MRLAAAGGWQSHGMAAWVYVNEAELTVDDAAQREALIKALLFLDPLSPRLKTMPPPELAIVWEALNEHGNPFARRTESANQVIRDRSPIASLEILGSIN